MFTIYPYLLDSGVWVFDDADKALYQEALVAGIPEMIETVCRRNAIPDYRNGGLAIDFAAEPFGHHDLVLDHLSVSLPESILPAVAEAEARGAVVEGAGEIYGNTYSLRGSDMQGWLCPALYKYFDQAPRHLYVCVRPKTAAEA